MWRYLRIVSRPNGVQIRSCTDIRSHPACWRSYARSRDPAKRTRRILLQITKNQFKYNQIDIDMGVIHGVDTGHASVGTRVRFQKKSNFIFGGIESIEQYNACNF